MLFLTTFIDGSFEIPAAKIKQQVAPVPKSAARIDLDENGFKIVKNTENGAHCVLVRLIDGEKSESIEAFRSHIEIHTDNNRTFRINTDMLKLPIQALGVCTSFESYLSIPLIV